ncbi:MAG: tetratricopeptide repeat protein [Flavobacteriales bacterium]|nr:tetratricopeptide repeat protein [Flavobacteriales bacterium]
METIKNNFKMVAAFALLVLTTEAYAQMSPYKFAQTFNQAFANVVAADYEEALPLLEQLHQSDPEHAQVGYLLAICRHNLKMEAGGTLPLLLSASKSYNYYHEHGNVNDRSVPAKAWFLLAEVYSELGRHKESIDAYRDYMSCIPLASLEHKRSVIQLIAVQRQLLAANGSKTRGSLTASLQP